MRPAIRRSFFAIAPAFLAALLLASCATTSVRYSSNPIGKLAVLGIQVSESVDTARQMLADPYAKNFLKDIVWPLAVDPTYRQLREPAAVTLSFGDQQAGGLTYTSALLEDMGFTEDMPGLLLMLDRQHRVRGFGRGFIMDGERQERVEREANRLVEDLLLNLEKSEKITYAEQPVAQQGIVSFGGKTAVGADDPANFDFQTDLKKSMIEEARRRSGASALEQPFFKYLGKPVPNYLLRRQDGSAVKLYELLQPRVTLLVVFISPANEGMRGHYNGVGMTLKTARGLYDNFALGLAEPGETAVPNAFPDAE
jgi:hypothetical protein